MESWQLGAALAALASFSAALGDNLVKLSHTRQARPFRARPHPIKQVASRGLRGSGTAMQAPAGQACGGALQARTYSKCTHTHH
jgi:hypothetical protein